MDNSVTTTNERSAELENFPILNSIDLMLDALKQEENAYDELPLEHLFFAGMYMRVMHMPVDNLVVGKKHRKKTLNILLKGEMLVYTKDDSKPKHLKAPHVFESQADVRKVLVAIQDSVFANIHVTDKTDVDDIEQEFTHPESKDMVETDLKNMIPKEAI